MSQDYGLPDVELFEDNPDPRVACVLLLDNSYSMAGTPITHLNTGLSEFKQALLADPLARKRVELALVTFGPVEIVTGFTPVDDFDPPTLQAREMTPMGEAILTALDLLERRKQVYRDHGIQYYRPWLFLLTDGAPTDNINEAVRRLREAQDQKKCTFFPVGVGDADMDTLKQLAGSTPVWKLQGLQFRELFRWLSSSVSQIAKSQPGSKISLAKPSDNVMQIEV